MASCSRSFFISEKTKAKRDQLKTDLGLKFYKDKLTGVGCEHGFLFIEGKKDQKKEKTDAKKLASIFNTVMKKEQCKMHTTFFGITVEDSLIIIHMC